ncbi:hypothetical protein B7P43_G02554 [Cryptotermes secundus]|uniref:Uncharacterized protein n=1 Tax=Cryptotermes secundus TaxID=105785 RepID=A0A2J7RNJ2_9NEOP|nr:uncharacterized protein LOC111868050 [Cryptotermes secundus]PNF42397.1 hypothetical protein B7P43_G02554 [Cryptotermes secundus]
MVVFRGVIMTGVRINFSILCLLLHVCTGESYFVTLSDNGPVVLGANITFKAELFTSYGTSPSGTFRFRWRDNAIPAHFSESEGPEIVAFWNVSYPAHSYGPGPYEVEVIVDKSTIFFFPISSQRINFNITALLNGQMSLIQSQHLRETEYVSSGEEVSHRVDLTEADGAFLKHSATSILTYWFVDCIYYGQTPGYVFNFNYTQPGKMHHVEALVVASYEPPITTTTPTTTTTSTTTTPISPNTTAVPPSMKTTTTVFPTTRTASSTVTTAAPGKNNTFEINSNEISSAMHMFPVQNSSVMPVPAPAVNQPNRTLANYTFFVPYVCLNSSIVPPDPNKTYGYFHRRLVVKAPVANVSVSGSSWLQHGDMLNLQVQCNGSAMIEYCIRILPGSYNVTGNETCPSYASRSHCQFLVMHYFREPSLYTVLIIIRNDVSKIVTKVGINVYEVTKRAQLSVIVVPVSCSLIAVILIVFGVAYYVQSKNRYTIEVADFDFGQANDMEYKTFRERLRESMSNAVNRSDLPEPGGSWSPSRKYGPMN